MAEIENLKEMAHKEDHATKKIESLKDDATWSFWAGFETALDPGKTMVNDQLREE